MGNPEHRKCRIPFAAIARNATDRMTLTTTRTWTFSLGPRHCFAALLAFGAVLFSTTLSAEEFLSEFESPVVSWKVHLPPQAAQVTIHERRRDSGKSGGAEFVRINSSRDNVRVRFEHSIPPATVLDELEVSLWVKSNREGFDLCMTVVIPDVEDPETHSPMSFSIVGDRYQTVDQWQQLKCRTSDKTISNQLRMLRDRKKIAINPKDEMYVERIFLDGQLGSGTTNLLFDNLAVGSLVRYQSEEIEINPEPARPVRQTYTQSGPPESQAHPRVEFLMHRLWVDQKPMFPRIVPDNGERPLAIASSGANVVWIKNIENTRAIESMRKEGLMVTATPPFAKGSEGEPLDAEDANLLPFQESTKDILFFMLGARMTPDGRPRLTSWTNQIRNADRRFGKRPIAADVSENERLCSRHLDMMGVSRHVIHSECSLSEYRDWIIQRRDRAWPDSFCFTWIQTEPAPQYTSLSTSSENHPMLEPEQIRLQVYAALAAGCRGLGYWTTSPLDGNTPAARERFLVLTQLNLELDLFEPWITSGGAPQLVAFNVDAPNTNMHPHTPKTAQSKTAAAAAARTKATAVSNAPPRTIPTQMQAAMFRAEQGALLLPMWLEGNAQFVPGQMVAQNVSIIIPGGGETAAAWEITTTGQLRHLNREPAAGGVKIRLPRFDQTAAILITNNQASVEELNQKILAIREQSAKTIVELAKLKLERIRQVDRSLQGLGVGRTNAPLLLGEAKINLDRAEADLAKNRYSEARQAADEAMQFGRILQRSHWEYAVRKLPNMTASPWALSFQTLPEHWRLTRQLEQLGSPDSQVNLLPSGEFEDDHTLRAEPWKWEQLTLEEIQSSAELHHVAKQGKSSLRLSATPTPGEPVPKLVSKPLITVSTPGINVHAGHYVQITGWTKVATPLVGSIDGALIYDSILGKPGAVRLKATQDWKQFLIIRPVVESTEMTVTISLQSIGEILIDDLRITELELDSEMAASPNSSSVAPATYAKPTDRKRTPNRR